MVARVAWVLAAITVLGLDAAGLPHAYARLDTVCHSSACAGSDEVLSPGDVGDLRELGISLDLYAGLMVGLSTLGTVVFAATAAAIFFRRSDDRMALLTSFMLAALRRGGVRRHDAVPGGRLHPVLWLPVHLLDYVRRSPSASSSYLFPNGRFVPRWTRWVALVWVVYFVFDMFLRGSSLAVLDRPLFFGFLGTLVFAQVYRYRRVSTPESASRPSGWSSVSRRRSWGSSQRSCSDISFAGVRNAKRWQLHYLRHIHLRIS